MTDKGAEGAGVRADAGPVWSQGASPRAWASWGSLREQGLEPALVTGIQQACHSALSPH